MTKQSKSMKTLATIACASVLASLVSCTSFNPLTYDARADLAKASTEFYNGQHAIYQSLTPTLQKAVAEHDWEKVDRVEQIYQRMEADKKDHEITMAAAEDRLERREQTAALNSIADSLNNR
jgi:hypothetical protein